MGERALALPKRDDIGIPAIRQEVWKIKRVAELCEHHRVCVQAGGNIGIFPIALAKIFDLVVTFEPSDRNWALLRENVSGIENISAINLALGDEYSRVSVRVGYPNNCGADSVVFDGFGDSLATTVDRQSIEHCDLIYLDVEGSEVSALDGALKTIARCRPVIVIENKGHIPGFDAVGLNGSKQVRDYVCEEFGYVFHKRMMRDDCFMPTERS